MTPPRRTILTRTMVSEPARSAALERQLALEVNAAMIRGSTVTAALGFVCTIMLVALMASGAVRDLTFSALFAFVGGAYSLVFREMARRGILNGNALRAAFVPFVCLPTMFFLGTHLLFPAGAATFINGPISLLYFVVILLTGFTFDGRLSVVAGLLGAVGYSVCVLIALPTLAHISTPDPAMTQDLQQFPIYSFKALLIAFAGVLTGALSRQARVLVVRVLEEEREKGMISRLFGQYVSDQVREKILAGKAGLKAEKRQVCVLFSDIRSFSAFSERRAPEEVLEHLNAYFDRMVEAIHASGGVVDKFIGDAVMGVFGGVVELERPCQAAFDAALRMRAALAEQNAEWTAAGRPTFENGVGLHFGEVVQGPLGSEARREFTVIGDAVNIASRIEGMCKTQGCPVLLTGMVYELLTEAQRQRCRSLGEVTVRGREEPVQLYGVK